MNNKVTVTGMEVKTKVSNNLLIAPLDIDTTTAPAESAYKTSLTTTIGALLEPVSTVNGTNFYYTSTTNVSGSGDALNDSYIEYNPATNATDTTIYANKFSENYGVTKTDAADYTGARAEGYIDYVFALKAQNTGSTVQYVNITSIGVTYAGIDTTEKAFRTAVFVTGMGTSTTPIAPTSGTGTGVVILAPTKATNFTSGNAVASTSALGAVTYGGASTIGSVEANTTRYFKVVVRLWLEGEDTTCNNNTFAALSDKWALDVTIELNGTENGNATTLGRNSGNKTDLTIGTAVIAANTMLVDGVTYYEINGVTVNSAKIYKTGTGAVAADTRIFIFTDNHPIDITNQINFVTAP